MTLVHTYVYKATVIRVVDGDTIHAQVSLGFDHYQNMTLRFAGINAPEMREAAGKVARMALSNRLPIGADVLLLTKKDSREKYGRYLATVYTPEGDNLNQWMVESGNAVLKDYA